MVKIKEKLALNFLKTAFVKKKKKKTFICVSDAATQKSFRAEYNNLIKTFFTHLQLSKC